MPRPAGRRVLSTPTETPEVPGQAGWTTPVRALPAGRPALPRLPREARYRTRPAPVQAQATTQAKAGGGRDCLPARGGWPPGWGRRLLRSRCRFGKACSALRRDPQADPPADLLTDLPADVLAGPQIPRRPAKQVEQAFDLRVGHRPLPRCPRPGRRPGPRRRGPPERAGRNRPPDHRSPARRDRQTDRPPALRIVAGARYLGSRSGALQPIRAVGTLSGAAALPRRESPVPTRQGTRTRSRSPAILSRPAASSCPSRLRPPIMAR
jgi:hypothetical protein